MRCVDSQYRLLLYYVVRLDCQLGMSVVKRSREGMTKSFH